MGNKKEHTHSIGLNGKKYTWVVKTIWELSKDLEPFDFKVSNFSGFNEDCWFGDRFKPTINKVLEHYQKIQNANFDFPIILGEDGRIMDGIHRICKAHLEGKKTIKAVQFIKDPGPDSIEDL
ncbi:hypothetical protein [Halobacteriovorax sp. JY17]|uniref:hypothetical protein n=1 Tax=Halobacteriovorax sp. JY17 TaxID=2014617 RepID=UPI0025C165C7|nr:hypothetical protein [Halobacteriovorax sp. JY17]